LRIEPARLTHVNPIALNMRYDDRVECRALGRTPKSALRLGLVASLYCLAAVEDDGTPVAMFGLNVVSAAEGKARPWFLGTDGVFNHPRELLREGRRILAWWTGEFPNLENIVAVRNERAVRLLTHWGAIIGGKQQFLRGVEFVPFRIPAIQYPPRQP
jgi:hypothetical protein